MPFNQFGSPYMEGVQGGFWGTGQDAKTWIDNITKGPLLNPTEFGKLDDQTRNLFGSYMGYLTTYAARKRGAQQGADAYRAVSGGDYSYQPIDVSPGRTTSTGGRIPAASSAGRGASATIPPAPTTTVHRDIYGRPTEQLTGQGIVRNMKGELIPQTATQVGAQRSLERAIPMAEMESDIDFLTKQEAIVKLKSDIDYPKRQEAREKMELQQLKTQQHQQGLDDKNSRLEKTFTHEKYIEKVKQEGRKALLVVGNELKTSNAELNQAFAMNMAQLKGEMPGTFESRQKHQEIVARNIEILKAKAELDVTNDERDETSRLALKQREYQYWLEKQEVNPDIFQNVAKLKEQQQRYGKPSATRLLTQNEFVADFTKKVGRAPTASELARMRGKFWQ